MPLSSDELEVVWSDLATALDAVPEDLRALFLTKLALVLAREATDPRSVAAAIGLAGQSLVATPPATPPPRAASNSQA